MESPYDLVRTLFAALAIGLLIGIERGWSDREESEGERIAGIRTFSLIGLLSGVTALVSQQITPWFIVAGFLGVCALIIAAHILEVRANKDVGTTTAFTMMLTFVLASWAAFGHPIPAMGVTVVVISLLGIKPVLHSWLRKITPKDFFSGVKLLVISLVLLPLLPNKGYGPWEALNPYWTWWMVVLISGISFLGYVVIQIAGEKKGGLVTAIGGGLVSSTAVTFSLARFAREQKNNVLSLSRSARQDLAAEVAVLGIILACLTNTLVKGVIFAFIAGFKDHFKLPLLMLAAMVPGCLVALVLL